MERLPTVIADNKRSCVRCKRETKQARVYCDIYNNQMLNIKGFDETGELHGCSEFTDELTYEQREKIANNLFFEHAIKIKQEVFE